jgi:hypothetical protein
MITRVCEQIFGEKIDVFFSKTDVMIIFKKLAVVLAKRANFCAIFFGENVFKIMTPVPDHLLRGRVRQGALVDPAVRGQDVAHLAARREDPAQAV